MNSWLLCVGNYGFFVFIKNTLLHIELFQSTINILSEFLSNI